MNKIKTALRIVTFLLSTLPGITSFCQNPERPKKTFTVNVARRDTTITADVLAGKSSIRPDENCTYNWYASNRIMETKGGYDGHLLHGSFTSFYGNNNIRQKGRFKKGLKEGKWISWFADGKINEITYWKHGLKNGKYIMYTSEGKVMVEARFKGDKLSGTMTSYQDGKVLSKRRYRRGEEIIRREKLSKVKESGASRREKRKNAECDTEPKKKFQIKEWWQKLFKKKEAKSSEKKEKKSKPKTSSAQS